MKSIINRIIKWLTPSGPYGVISPEVSALCESVRQCRWDVKTSNTHHQSRDCGTFIATHDRKSFNISILIRWEVVIDQLGWDTGAHCYRRKGRNPNEHWCILCTIPKATGYDWLTDGERRLIIDTFTDCHLKFNFADILDAFEKPTERELIRRHLLHTYEGGHHTPPKLRREHYDPDDVEPDEILFGID